MSRTEGCALVAVMLALSIFAICAVLNLRDRINVGREIISSACSSHGSPEACLSAVTTLTTTARRATP